MDFVEYECPNCGGQVDVKDDKVAFCAYCGTKLVKKTAATDHIKDYVRRSLSEIKAGRYEDCKSTVDEAIAKHPDDSELNFIKAVVSQDESYLEKVAEDEVSADVAEACVDHLALIKRKRVQANHEHLREKVRTSVYKVGNKVMTFESEPTRPSREVERQLKSSHIENQMVHDVARQEEILSNNMWSPGKFMAMGCAVVVILAVIFMLSFCYALTG